MARIMDAMLPKGILLWLVKGLMHIMGLFPAKHDSETFAQDILIEANVEYNDSPEPFLPQISVPILIMGGDNDLYFPLEYYKKTAELIPQATLRIYEGKGHGAFMSKQAQRDLCKYLLLENPKERL